MSKKEKSFDELFAIAKSKGMSDIEALNAANDKRTYDLIMELMTEDIPHEVIEPKQITDDTNLPSK
jgi:ferritin-like protein